MPILPVEVLSRLGLLAVVGLVGADVTTAQTGQRKSPELRAFTGGIYEASGVSHVAGADGVLFVDDSRTREIFWMELGAAGEQRAPAVAVPLGVEIEDPEAIASDGTFFYVLGSQSKGNGPAGAGLARFTFDAAARRIDRMESIARLKAWLVDRVPEFQGLDASRGNDELNIEGLAWDPAGARLLLGFRTPVIDGQALIVPVKLRDPRAAFTTANLELDGGAIRVPLNGAGIRSLDHDSTTGTLLIIAEPTKGNGGDFQLLEWKNRGKVQPVATFRAGLQPEGVTRVSIGGASGIFVVFDTSRHTLIR